MLSAPVLQAQQTDRPGVVSATLQGTGPMQLMYAVETGSDALVFVPCGTFEAAGTYDVRGLSARTWLSMYAVCVDDEDETIKLSPPSNLVRVRGTMAPAYRLTASKQEQLELVPGRTNAFGMTVTLVESTGMSVKAFLYRRENFGETPGYRDVFVGVCKPGDFSYPEDEPDLELSPLFRSEVVPLVDRSPVGINEDWFALLYDLDELVHVMELWQEGQVPL